MGKKRISKLPFSLLSFEKECKLMLPNQSYLQLFCFVNNIFPNRIFHVSQVREKEGRRKREIGRVRGRGFGFKFTEFIVVRGAVLSTNLMKRRKGPWRWAWLYRNNAWSHVLKGAWEEESEISLRGERPMVWESGSRKETRSVKNPDIFPVEKKKVEVIHARDFTLFVKRKVLHSSSER